MQALYKACLALAVAVAIAQDRTGKCILGPEVCSKHLQSKEKVENIFEARSIMANKLGGSQ